MNRWARITFLILLGASLWLLYRTLAPFLVPVLLASIFVVLTYPMQRWLEKRLKGRRSIAAVLSTLILFLGFILPAAALLLLVLREAMEVFPQVRDFLAGLDVSTLLGPDSWMGRLLPERAAELLPSATETLSQLGAALGSLAGTVLSGLATATVSVTLNGFLLIVSVYYFYLDGPALLDRLMRLIPMEGDYQRALFHEFRSTIFAVFFGTAVVAVVQGALTWLILAVVGVPSALLWGFFATVLSFLPLVGPAMVWLPAAIILLLMGNTWQGIVVAVWGTFVISIIDNILRPLLVKGRLHLHPLMVFLTLFGGIAAFGMIGFLLGPIIASLAMALLRIWERDFLPQEAARTDPPTAPLGPPAPPASPPPTPSL